MARDLLAEAGFAFPELERVAVVTGPGAFAGVRVGTAFARGLALALDIPAVGVSALEALARQADAAGATLAAAIDDARRGELVWALALRGSAASEPRRGSLAEARADIVAALEQSGEGSARLAGSGAPLLAAGMLLDTGLRRPDLRVVADLAARADPAACPARPLYARPPDAKLPGGVEPDP